MKPFNSAQKEGKVFIPNLNSLSQLHVEHPPPNVVIKFFT